MDNRNQPSIRLASIRQGKSRYTTSDKMPDARMKAEKRLHTFVRVVAFLERTGNALGRLVLIWATVVVGFSKNLGPYFWYSAAFVILESFRAFSRESKSDDQLLFKTTGDIELKRVSLPIGSGSLYYVNAMAIVLLFFGGVAPFLPFTIGILGSTAFLPLLMVLSKVSKTSFPKLIEKMSRPGNSWWLRFMPACALILATAVNLVYHDLFGLIFGGAAILQWFIFNSLARGQLPEAFSCLQRVKHLHAILITGIAGSLLVAFGVVGFVTLVAPLVQGNLQVPLSMTRIMVALLILVEYDPDDPINPDDKTNLMESLKALYIMVMCQGILYILACILESFSYFPRTSLALRCGLNDKLGLESINIYYEQTYDTFVQESILNTKDIGLVKFAVSSLNSEVSRDKKLASVRILHSLLQQQQDGPQEETLNTEVVSEITASTKAVTTLVSMLGSTVPEDADIRLFAAKVVADLAPYLRITGISGTMQMVCSLLDAVNQPGRHDSSTQRMEGNLGNAGDQGVRDASGSSRVDGNGVNAGDQGVRDASGSSRVDGNGVNAGAQEIGHVPSSPTMDPEQGNAVNQAVSHGSSSTTVSSNRRNADDQQIRQSLSSSTLNVGNNNNQLPMQAHSTQQATRNSEGRYQIFKFWQHKTLWSTKEDSFKGEVSFPALGMSILQSFADDVDNCAEISRATEVLSRIIGFISHITDATTPKQKQVTTTSLVLVAKLASVEWRSGVTLRKELSENPFLVSKLAEILESTCSGPEQWKPAMDIIARLAMDEETKQEIGGIHVIITKLMHAFVGRDEPSNTYDPSLRTAAGQALAMLAMDSAGNCSAILDAPVNNPIMDLNQKFLNKDNEYLAANILRSLWAHSSDELPHWNSLNSHMSSKFIDTILWRIMFADGKGMEALIGLASQICSVDPQLFISCLGPHPGDAPFVQKLVDELNANRRPSPEFPTMRRALVELTISMGRSCGRYAAVFRDHGMVEALSTVEKTPSKVEKYRLFYGSAGVVPFPEGGGTLSNLAARAKGLIATAVNV